MLLILVLGKKVDAFVSLYTVCDESVADYAVARPCREDERLYMKPRPDSYDFTYVYDFLFKEYDITFPLTDFEAGMLTLMIAPSQLHPNSWTFLKCFELLCEHLGFEPSTNVFTHFYQIKFGRLVGWVSLSATYGGSLFTLYSSLYKYFKTKFFKLHCHPGDTERRLFFYQDFIPWFPLYWQRPTRFKPWSEYQLSPKER